MLRKIMLWCIVFAMSLPVAYAEDFGIARRTPAQPKQSPSQQILPYVVRVIAFDTTGQSFGTGSYVGIHGEYGIILTNQHVVGDSEGLVHVHFPSGFSSFGAFIKGDDKWDLALIAISKPPLSIPTLSISQTPSKQGDPLWIVGYGSSWVYQIAEGRCVRYMALESPKDGTASLNEILEVSVSARKGDSGGPILNQKGELAGVLFGSDMIRNTAGTYCERVNRFLTDAQEAMVGQPSRPETLFAATEKDGPRYSLRESRNAVPKSTTQAAPQRAESTSSSVSPIGGVRSSSRRYVLPGNNGKLRIQQSIPLRGQEASAGIRIPLTSLTPADQSTKIVQTAYLASSETTNMTIVIPVASSTAVDRYPLKLAADRRDGMFTMFMSMNVLFAVGLACLAVRVLRR
jgi:hypothetical protein